MKQVNILYPNRQYRNEHELLKDEKQTKAKKCIMYLLMSIYSSFFGQPYMIIGRATMKRDDFYSYGVVLYKFFDELSCLEINSW